MDSNEARVVLAYAAATWAQLKVDEGVIQLWETELADVDSADVAIAYLRSVAKREAWPPTPQRVAAVCTQVQAPAFDDALKAVLELVRSVGRNGIEGAVIEWEHPAVAALARSRKWDWWCSLDDPIDRATYAQLRDAYTERVARADAELQLQQVREQMAALRDGLANAGIEVGGIVKSIEERVTVTRPLHAR